MHRVAMHMTMKLELSISKFMHRVTMQVIKKLGLTNLRLTLNATNLLTITGYDGYDPEIGVSTASNNVYGLDNGRYPSPTSVTLGVNVSF